METTKCIGCGTEIQYEKAGIPYNIIPTVCDTCYARLTRKPEAKQEAWTDSLPCKEWDEKLGNRTALNKIGSVVFLNKQLRTGVVYVVGGVAAGKTVSVSELARCACRRGYTGSYHSCPDILSEYSRELGKREEDKGDGLEKRLSNQKGVLIIDDLGVGKLTDRGVELLYQVFNKRMENKDATTWITSNLTIDQVGAWIMKACQEELTAQRITRRIAERAVVVQL